jgi:hypothetical protein
VFGIRDPVAPAAGDGAALLLAEADGRDADAAGEQPGEVRRVLLSDEADGDDGEFVDDGAGLDLKQRAGVVSAEHPVPTEPVAEPAAVELWVEDAGASVCLG